MRACGGGRIAERSARLSRPCGSSLAAHRPVEKLNGFGCLPPGRISRIGISTSVRTSGAGELVQKIPVRAGSFGMHVLVSSMEARRAFRAGRYSQVRTRLKKAMTDTGLARVEGGGEA